MRENLLLDSPEEAADEFLRFKRAGGGTVCDISPRSVRVKQECLPSISKDTGLHIVLGTSFYVGPLQWEESKAMGVREKAEVLVREVTEGAAGGMKCGLIGEIGCSWPLADSELTTLKAAALAQKQTGWTHHLYTNEDLKCSSPLHIIVYILCVGEVVQQQHDMLHVGAGEGRS